MQTQSAELKPLICVDCDGVLFNTRPLFKVPALERIDRPARHALFAEFRETGQEFFPRPFFEFALAKGHISADEKEELIRHFCSATERADQLLFDDAIPFLKQFPKHMLALLTRADPEWQLANIRTSKVARYVGQTFIVQGDQGKRDVLSGLVQRFRPVCFIDDTPEEIEQARNVPGVDALLLDRLQPTSGESFADLTAVAEHIRSEIGSPIEARTPSMQ